MKEIHVEGGFSPEKRIRKAKRRLKRMHSKETRVHSRKATTEQLSQESSHDIEEDWPLHWSPFPE